MVRLKRKVTLRKKVAVEEQLSQPVSNALTHRIKKAMFVLVVVGLLVLISVLFFPDKDVQLVQNTEEPSVNQNATKESITKTTDPILISDSLVQNNETVPSVENVTTENITIDTPIETRDEISSESTKKAQKESYPEETKEKASFSSNTLDEKAKSVIRGNFGNGQERKDKLGAEYNAIQARVNEMYRNGLVK